MAPTDQVRDPLETPPPALANRTKAVTLTGGKVVTIEKWSWSKLWDLSGFAGDPEKIPLIARDSVAPADREAIDALSMEDQLAIAAAAVEFNMPGNTGPNLIALANAWRRLTRGMTPEGSAAAATP